MLSPLAMSSKVKRTYGSKKTVIHRAHPPLLPSSPVSDDASLKRKRPLQEQSNVSLKTTQSTFKKHKTSIKQGNSAKQKTLTQLHFCIDQTILRACPRCGLSYTKGAPDDESLHRTHCSRIEKGMEWGREEEKETVKSSVVQFAGRVQLKDGRKGRIVYFRADVGGKIGQKVCSLPLPSLNRH